MVSDGFTSGTRHLSCCIDELVQLQQLVGIHTILFLNKTMETLYSVPFTVLECPNIKLKKPSWLHMPSAMTVYAAVIVSYFLITGGKPTLHANDMGVCT